MKPALIAVFILGAFSTQPTLAPVTSQQGNFVGSQQLTQPEKKKGVLAKLMGGKDKSSQQAGFLMQPVLQGQLMGYGMNTFAPGIETLHNRYKSVRGAFNSSFGSFLRKFPNPIDQLRALWQEVRRLRKQLNLRPGRTLLEGRTNDDDDDDDDDDEGVNSRAKTV